MDVSRICLKVATTVVNLIVNVRVCPLFSVSHIILTHGTNWVRGNANGASGMPPFTL
jgi:hypothetical protein